MWAGQVERMEGERLRKRADALRVEGRRGRGRPFETEMGVLGKRDLAEVGGEWRKRQGIGGSGDGSETGLVTKKNRKKIDDRYWCQSHPELQG